MDPKTLKEELSRDSRRLGVIRRKLDKLAAKIAELRAEEASIEQRWDGKGDA